MKTGVLAGKVAFTLSLDSLLYTFAQAAKKRDPKNPDFLTVDLALIGLDSKS